MKQRTKEYKGQQYNKAFKGDIEELGNHVYAYGTRDQGNEYIKTTEAIAEYVGREYSKEMRILVKDLDESIPEEPKEPKVTKEAATSPFALKKYDTELRRYYNKLDKYEEHKAKVFIIIKGQCTLKTKNQIESMKDYADIQKTDDVIKLLKCLKELAFTTVEVQYEYWTLQQSMRKLLTMRQQENEGLPSFYKRFINEVDVTETQWGTLVPTKIGNDTKTRNKFLTCVFIAGVDAKRYDKVIKDLNNSYLTGVNHYPSTVETALTMLSHFQQDKEPRSGKNEDRDSMGFSQSRLENITCYNCGKKGHYKSDCPETGITGTALAQSGWSL